MNRPRRHHYIPRFVQEGFASRRTPRATYVWLYRRGGSPVETNTVNVAVERDFHWSRTVPEIETRVSRFEGRFVDVLRAIRAGHLSDIPTDDVTKFVRHFAIRLPIMRRFLEEFARDFVALVRSQIERLELRTLRYSTLLEAMNAAGIGEAAGDQAAVSRAKASASDIVRHDLEALLFNARREVLLDVVDGMDVLSHIREMHSETLVDEMLGLNAPNRGSSMTWSTRKFDEPLILGDVGPLAISPDAYTLEPMVGASGAGRSLILAIDQYTLLVGERSVQARTITAGEWNRATAHLSHSQFIAGHVSDELALLASQIGDAHCNFSLVRFIERHPEFVDEFTKESLAERPSRKSMFMRTPSQESRPNRFRAAVEAYFGRDRKQPHAPL